MMKILYAEDELQLRTEIALILEMDGHTVLTADDGQFAWEAFLEEQPDLIITDIKMPRMTGIQFLELVQASVEKPPPAIVTSAYAPEDLQVDVSGLHIAHYLTKPFSLMGLLQIVGTYSDS